MAKGSAIYGLKQSPRSWYKRYDSFMLSVGARLTAISTSSSTFSICLFSLGISTS
ncbi:hypothetical protein SELMODRAFT_106568 [Selaginella moellendorffii]|uniref:Reverse transcriptase Ty1/copia-type domain-containing protein n=1 Tax=Selaginella moellendorffii TaxID=88036 RepID=D8S1M6_SELML|nr:hypothetical protein SELMODRAFT_106568 [Selaginella moellendorffii]